MKAHNLLGGRTLFKIPLAGLRLKRRPRVTIVVCAIVSITLVGFNNVSTRSQNAMPDYKNPRLSVEQRVTDLLGRMTVEEKVAQLICLWQGRPEVGPQG